MSHVRQTPDATPAIRVSSVSFAYRTRTGGTSPYGPRVEREEWRGCLQDVDFSCDPGSLTVLCGASGSGKTTALRLLNGLVPHMHHGKLRGSVEVMGADVPSMSMADAGRTSATVFQNPRNQFFASDVTSELAFRGENYGLEPDLIRERSTRAARKADVEHLMGRRLTALSGGELQKVACAQAVAAHTRVLLFDEPTANLSPRAIDGFAKLLASLKEEGNTIVVAEHRLYFLRDLADVVLMFDAGRIARRFAGSEFFAMEPGEAQRLGLRSLTRPSFATPPFAARPERDRAMIADPTGERPAPGAGARAKGPPSAGEPNGESFEGGGERGSAEGRRPGPSGLSLRSVRFSYGKRRVLDLDRLDLPSGMVTVLVGDNGAGKSTLARLICGLARPDSGTVALDGSETRARDRVAASYVVMQDVDRQLFADSVRRELTIGPVADGSDPDAILAELGLDALAERHPLSLSGGQKQRLVVASAIACRKRVYVFDEPTSGADLHHLRSIARRIRALALDGAVVLVITHDLELASVCADRVVELRRLDCVEDGDAQFEVRAVGPIP